MEDQEILGEGCRVTLQFFISGLEEAASKFSGPPSPAGVWVGEERVGSDKSGLKAGRGRLLGGGFSTISSPGRTDCCKPGRQQEGCFSSQVGGQ